MAVITTPRRRLIEAILRKATSGSSPIAFHGTTALRSAVDTAGFSRTIAADGLDEIPAAQAAQFVAQAIEAAGATSAQPQLVRAIYTAERDRAIDEFEGQSTTYSANQAAADAEAAGITGTTLNG